VPGVVADVTRPKGGGHSRLRQYDPTLKNRLRAAALRFAARRSLSPLPPSLRSPLLAFALSAFVFICACAFSQNNARAAFTRHGDGLPVPHVTIGQRAASLAVREVGVPYRWGGISPAGGFDCSGLVYWAYGRLGIALPHSSYALYDEGRRVSRTRMKPGDLLFFSGLGHVGIYIGRGRMVHAPHTGTRVQIVNLGRSSYGSAIVGIRRVSRK
jgi:hypothetical protein